MYSVPSLTVETSWIYTQQKTDENLAWYVNSPGKGNIWLLGCTIRSSSQCPGKQGSTSSRHPPLCQDSAKNDGVFVSWWKRLYSGYTAEDTFCYLDLSKYVFSHVLKKTNVRTGMLYLAEKQIAVLADCKHSITN